MDIERKKEDHFNDEYAVELLQEEYYDFLHELWELIEAECNERSFLWFDRCTFPLFVRFAEQTSTGPPRNL